MRMQGLIPAVVYGGENNYILTINPKELSSLIKELGSENAVFPLAIEGEGGEDKNVIIKEMQVHPTSDELLHVDFIEVSMDKAISVDIPIAITGEPDAAKSGEGVVEQLLNSVEVECLPALIPHRLEIDVSLLEIGQVLYVGDLTAPEGVQILRDSSMPVVMLSAVKIVVEEEVEEEEGEVIEGAEEEGEATEEETEEESS